MDSRAAIVAKKKSGKVPKPVDQWKRKPLAIQIRGSTEWKEWVGELAAYDRGMTIPILIENLLAKHARDIGFAKEPPER